MTVSDNGNVIRFSTRNSVTDSRRIIKIGMWVGHEKRCTRNSQGQKVKGQGQNGPATAQKHRIYPVNVTR